MAIDLLTNGSPSGGACPRPWARVCNSDLIVCRSRSIDCCWALSACTSRRSAAISSLWLWGGESESSASTVTLVSRSSMRYTILSDWSGDPSHAGDGDGRRQRLAIGGRGLNASPDGHAATHTSAHRKPLAVGIAFAAEVELRLIADADEELVGGGIGSAACH